MLGAVLRLTIRFRWVVAVFWVLSTAASAVFLPSLGSVIRNDTATFLPADAPSVVATALAAPFLAPTGPTGILVAWRDDGSLSSADQATIETLEGQLRHDRLVVSVTNVGLSADGQAFVADLRFVSGTQGGGPAGKAAVAGVRALFRPAEATGVQFALTGALPILVDQQAAAAHVQNSTLVISVVMVLVLLIAAFRAVLAPLVALAPAALALALASPLIAESTRVGVQISSLLQLLLTALVLGAGTDYGLFLLFRYRENLRRGLDPNDAIVAAGSRVGTSITFSALTVITALLSLLLASFGLYRGVGPGLAIGVAVVLLVELTFLPAMLSIVGPRLFWPASRRPGTTSSGAWGRLAGRVSHHPAAALAVGSVVLGGLSLFLLDYSPSGFNPGGAIADSDSAQGEAVVAEHFGQLVTGVTDVVLRFANPVWATPEILDATQDDLWGTNQFSSVTGALDPNGTDVQPVFLTFAYRDLGPPQKLPVLAPPGSYFPTPLYEAYRSTAQFISADGRTVLFRTTLSAGSSGSTAALQAVPAIRLDVAQVARDVGAVRWGLVGQAPSAADVSAISGSDVVRIIPVVVLVLTLLLAAVLRSLFAPLYLVLTVVLSYMASLGLAVLIFVVVGHQLGVNFTLPFFMFIFIMALGEDYNILVMSRIREESARLPLGGAITEALSTTGTTVTTAGLILAGTFGVLATTSSGQVRQIGTGLALGILLDTFLVRTLLVPSAAALSGRWNWWPRRSWSASLNPPNRATARQDQSEGAG